MVGVGIGVLGGQAHVADLALDPDAPRVHLVGDLPGPGHVLLEGILGSVDHDGCEAVVNAGLADLEIRAVVQVKADVQAGILDGGVHQSS